MPYRYSIFGLIIDSCIELPQLPKSEGIPQIRIEWGDVPPVLEESHKTTPRFQAKPGCILIKGENSARILVSQGTHIQVQRLQGANDHTIRSFILSSALGAILHQRNLLPLHASGIKTNDKCVIFCGRPGTGKSTIANFFLRRQYELHTDDICVIKLDEEQNPLVFPTYPQLKLWGETIEKNGDNVSSYSPVPSFPNKYFVPVNRFNSLPLHIKSIFILAPYEKDTIEILPIKGMNKHKALKFQTYRRRFLDGLGTTQSHFNIAVKVAQQVPMFRVHRPKTKFLLDELGNKLEEIFLHGE